MYKFRHLFPTRLSTFGCRDMHCFREGLLQLLGVLLAAALLAARPLQNSLHGGGAIKPQPFGPITGPPRLLLQPRGSLTVPGSHLDFSPCPLLFLPGGFVPRALPKHIPLSKLLQSLLPGDAKLQENLTEKIEPKSENSREKGPLPRDVLTF